MEVQLIRDLLEEPKRFEGWLESREQESIVGIRGVAISCPIANFLTQAGLKTKVRAYYILVYDSSSNSNIATVVRTSEVGTWIAEFVKAIDETDSKQITADTALQVLKTI